MTKTNCMLLGTAIGLAVALVIVASGRTAIAGLLNDPPKAR